MLKAITVSDRVGATQVYEVPESLASVRLVTMSANFTTGFAAGNFAIRAIIETKNVDIKGIYPAADVGATRTVDNFITWGNTGTAYSSVDGTTSFTAVPMQAVELAGGDQITLAGNTLNATDGWSNVVIWVEVQD